MPKSVIFRDFAETDVETYFLLDEHSNELPIWETIEWGRKKAGNGGCGVLMQHWSGFFIKIYSGLKVKDVKRLAQIISKGFRTYRGDNPIGNFKGPAYIYKPFRTIPALDAINESIVIANKCKLTVFTAVDNNSWIIIPPGLKEGAEKEDGRGDAHFLFRVLMTGFEVWDEK